MAPFQVFFVRGVKTLFGRGSNEEKLAAIETYSKDPNPDAVLIFVADHISIPADARAHGDDGQRALRAYPGDHGRIIAPSWNWRAWKRARRSAGLPNTALTRDVKIDADAARELVDALGGDMMMVSNELEKLILYVGEKKRVTLGDVETMVLAAKQRSLYELTDAISSKDRVRALADSGRHPEHRRRRRSCHRASLHAGQDLPPDAGHPGAQRARPAHAVGGTVAGIPRATFRRGRHHQAGAPLQIEAGLRAIFGW